MPAALAQQKPAVDPVKVDAAIKAAFPSAPADWAPRLMPDETMKQCSAHGNLPPQSGGRRNPGSARRRPSNIRPTASSSATGRRASRWRNRITACASPTIRRATHEWRQLLCLPSADQGGGELRHDRPEPSEYGKMRNFSEAETKAAYEKIYNSHAAYPCSKMPRFGANKVLTIEQIKEPSRC